MAGCPLSALPEVHYSRQSLQQFLFGFFGALIVSRVSGGQPVTAAAEAARDLGYVHPLGAERAFGAAGDFPQVGHHVYPGHGAEVVYSFF